MKNEWDNFNDQSPFGGYRIGYEINRILIYAMVVLKL